MKKYLKVWLYTRSNAIAQMIMWLKQRGDWLTELKNICPDVSLDIWTIHQVFSLRRASSKSSIAKHLLENHATCGRDYNDDQFKILRSCTSNFQLTVNEAICILTLQPTLCVQREFDYTTALI